MTVQPFDDDHDWSDFLILGHDYPELILIKFTFICV